MIISILRNLEIVTFEWRVVKPRLEQVFLTDFIAKDAVENLIGTVRAKYPSLDVELMYGGQPVYDLTFRMRRSKCVT